MPQTVPSPCSGDTRLASPNSGKPPNKGRPRATRSMRRPSELGTPRPQSRKNCCDCTLAPASLKTRCQVLSKGLALRCVLPQRLQHTRWSPSGSSLHWHEGAGQVEQGSKTGSLRRLLTAVCHCSADMLVSGELGIATNHEEEPGPEDDRRIAW